MIISLNRDYTSFLGKVACLLFLGNVPGAQPLVMSLYDEVVYSHTGLHDYQLPYQLSCLLKNKTKENLCLDKSFDRNICIDEEDKEEANQWFPNLRCRSVGMVPCRTLFKISGNERTLGQCWIRVTLTLVIDFRPVILLLFQVPSPLRMLAIIIAIDAIFILDATSQKSPMDKHPNHSLKFRSHENRWRPTERFPIIFPCMISWSSAYSGQSLTKHFPTEGKRLWANDVPKLRGIHLTNNKKFPRTRIHQTSANFQGFFDYFRILKKVQISLIKHPINNMWKR